MYSITGARHGLSDDQTHRKRAYITAMMLRVVCFLSAIVVPAPLPIRVALAAAAIFLPYFAVILANSHRRRITSETAQTGTFSAPRPTLGTDSQP